jgi:hypothetical protein
MTRGSGAPELELGSRHSMSLGNVEKNAEVAAALRAGLRVSGGCCPSERGSSVKQQHPIRAVARRE